MVVQIAVVLVAVAVAPDVTPTPAPTAAVSKLRSRGVAESRQGESLADVARRIKLNNPDGRPLVLTNDRVKELAQGVELTTSAPSGPAPRQRAPRPADTERSKAIWQQRYQEARGRVLYWESEVTRLEGEVARLESEFYARDDPAYRDGVIKPAWDKAIVDLRVARETLDAARRGPDETIAEASRDGALPGWFRGLPDPTPVPGAPLKPTPAATPRQLLLPPQV